MVDGLDAALLEKTTCPHCWHYFEPHNTLWIASHPTLRGDLRLGSDAYRRFLPSRFTPRGGAIDEGGTECTQLACPNCHLHIPRLCLELKPWFVSVFGAPYSGKSYFLGSMIWALRRRLPGMFRVSFTDTDAKTNEVLAGYEQALFSNPNPDELLPLFELIQKTKEQGDLYDTALFGSAEVQFPRPFLFTIRPQPDHPAATDPAPISRILCLYDNAGESFLAGGDSAVNPVTRHMAESSLLLFLFDPAQHQPFRQRLAAAKIEVASDVRPGQGVNRQDLILTEAANRVRRFAGLRDNEKHDRPLIVIVTKQDVWEPLVPEMKVAEPIIAQARGPGTSAMNLDRLDDLSRAIRRLLLEVTPEVVTAAESFAKTVTYVGVSSFGVAPVRHQQSKHWAIRPAEVKPSGVEIPVLFGLSKQFPRLVPSGRRPRRA